MIVIAAPELDPGHLPPACRARLMPAPPRLSRLTADWIAERGAHAVVFALFARQPDAWQVCGHLRRMGYAGRVIALSPPLPNRRMVERELRADYPGLRLRVMPVLLP
ncbi:MAG: hypothetical protein ACT4OK_21460 [Gemmobacter sp.]